MIILKVIFFICIGAIVHSYLFYPLLLRILPGRKPGTASYDGMVSLIIAAHNEETVIESKLRSVLDNCGDKQIEILIGDDASTDNTAKIIQRMVMEDSRIIYQKFERSGKTRILNALTPKASGGLLVFTDANVFFTESTLNGLLKGFHDENVGIVGANILSSNPDEGGIAYQESAYISRENRIKYNEGRVWGTMMGAFGGCYAMRKELFLPVPEHFIVDDFYLTMKVLEKKQDAILSLSATCYEDISTRLNEEFRRKVRLSMGNFQNLGRFGKFLFNRRWGLAFSFFSHKVIRWLTPILFIIAYAINFTLVDESVFFIFSLAALSTILLVPLLDMILRAVKIRSVLLRFITYFCTMNLALLVGLIRYFRGVRSSVWEPTKRNQV